VIISATINCCRNLCEKPRVLFASEASSLHRGWGKGACASGQGREGKMPLIQGANTLTHQKVIAVTLWHQ
jgi:hypothetical protein